MIANLLLTYQASTVDYGGCVILYLLPVGCGKAEIRCYHYPPPGQKVLAGPLAMGRRKPHALSSVSPQKSINSKQLTSNLPAVSYTNPYPRFSITRQLSLG